MLYGRHFQNAYVTRNLEAGIAKIRAMGEIRAERRFATDMTVTTPQGPASLGIDVALLWVDDLQYELIRPTGGELSIYRDGLPADDGLAFHHICYRVPDWDACLARAARQDLPLVMQGETDVVKFLYLDARKTLGHFIEYYWTTEGHWAANGGRP